MQINVSHIINPIYDLDKPPLQYIQAVTFKSIQNALKFYSTSEKDIEFIICSTQYPEDHASIPPFIQKLSNLEQSVLDVNETLIGKKLPLIKDILNIGIQETEADYLIYSNIDIALQPHFYDFVAHKINKGHDAIVINRRRIPFKVKPAEEASQHLINYYGTIGRSHPGFDCFIIKKSVLEQFILDNICIGISFLETALIHNIAAFSKNPLYVLDQHLTFHLGTDVLVPRKKNPFYWHNRNIFFNEIQPQLKPLWDVKRFPYGNKNIMKRGLGWGLNPSLFSRNFLELEGKNLTQSLKIKLDEIRWRFLQK